MRLSGRVGPISVSGNIPLVDATMGIGVIGAMAAAVLLMLLALWSAIWLLPLGLLAWLGLKWLIYVEGREGSVQRLLLYSLFGLVICGAGWLYKVALGAWGRWALSKSGKDCGSVGVFSLGLPEGSTAYLGDQCRPTGTFLFVDSIPFVALSLGIIAIFGLVIFHYEDGSSFDLEIKQSTSLGGLLAALGLRFVTAYSTLLFVAICGVGWMIARHIREMGVDDWRTIEFIGLDGNLTPRTVAIYRGVRHARADFLMNYLGSTAVVVGIVSIFCIVAFRWRTLASASVRSKNICQR